MDTIKCMLLIFAMTDQYQSVSEIKGAPCTRCAHFHDWVHNFRRCAPGVCTFFEHVIIATYI